MTMQEFLAQQLGSSIVAVAAFSILWFKVQAWEKQLDLVNTIMVELLDHFTGVDSGG